MKTATITLVLALAAIGTGCTTTSERSRNLADPSVSAKTLAQQVCSNCHGIDGNSISPNFPKLAGQQEAYFIAQLKGFRSHGRSDPAGFEYMWGISHNLTDEQIKGLAAYFAQQTPTPNPPVHPERISAGKAIFEKGIPSQNVPACEVCHGPQGKGNATFPRIADQHADYIIKQLQVFKKTEERPEGTAMKQVTHALTDENMQAVAAYLNSMPVK
ncbi:MAG: c-type cytochrome [Burkholderiales bacterium]